MRIGIDLGGTKIAAGLVDGGRVVREIVVPTPRGRGSAPIAAQLRALIDGLAKGVRVEGVGMGAPGRTSGTRIVELSLHELNGVDMAKALRARVPFALENDANCFALGEHRFGAGRRARHLVAITLGTGLGSGIVIAGELHRGAHGAAPELGHLIHDIDAQRFPQSKTGGKWESLLCGPMLLARYERLGGEGGARGLWTSRGLAARTVREDAARHLAIFCANAVRAFDPDLIVVGGGVAHRALVDAANARMPAYGCEGILRLSALKEKAAILGAASLLISPRAGRAPRA